MTELSEGGDLKTTPPEMKSTNNGRRLGAAGQSIDNRVSQ